MVLDIFHREFTPTPYWWEAFTPTAEELADVPPSARVAIIGGGYAGLSTALELAKHGIDAVVLEANELEFGASTRNGGAVSGGVNVGKSFTGRTPEVAPGRAERMLSDASDAFALIDRLIDEEKISCFWEKPGRFVGAWTKKHFHAQARRLAILNAAAQSGAHMVPRGRQRDEIASDYYFGGMVVERSGKLHPALYYKGLLEACRRRTVAVCAKAAVTGIGRTGGGGRSRPAGARSRPAMS
jgi:glycine/D-amino acid oxidase-like deaminating enzyme